MARALVLLAPGFEETEAVTIIDVLRRGAVEVTVASIGEALVHGNHDIGVHAETSIVTARAEDYDALVLPGGMPGAKHLREDPRVLALVRAMNDAGKLIAAVCAAPTVLEAAGILRGKRVTAYPGHDVPSATLVPEGVVEDGNVVTGRGPALAMAFALKVVERLSGAGTSRHVAEKLLFTG